MVNHLLVGTVGESYRPISTQETGRRAGDPLGPVLSTIALQKKWENITADNRACRDLDGMLKVSPATPLLSEDVFIGFGDGECWNSS